MITQRFQAIKGGFENQPPAISDIRQLGCNPRPHAPAIQDDLRRRPPAAGQFIEDQRKVVEFLLAELTGTFAEARVIPDPAFVAFSGKVGGYAAVPFHVIPVTMEI